MPRRGVPRRPARVDFGDKSWVDVQKKLAKWARYNYPRVDTDLLEEALQDAVVDGMTYWQSLPSSNTGDTQKNFDFAVFRGKQFLKRHVPMLCQRHGEVPYDVDGIFWDREDGVETPDEVLEDQDLSERARRVLEDLPTEELADLFDNLLTDETQQELADRLGITRASAQNRREVRVRRIKERARSYGLF